MAQPYKPKGGGIIAAPEIILKFRTELALDLVHTIMAWAYVENLIGTCLVGMLGVEAEPLIKDYISSGYLSAKQKKLEKHGKERLPQEWNEILEVALALVTEDAKQRNDLVHGTWALAGDVPDGILFTPAKHHLNDALEVQKNAAYFEKFIAAGPGSGMVRPNWATPPQKGFIYKSGDFARLRRDFSEIGFMLACVGTRSDKLPPNLDAVQLDRLRASRRYLSTRERLNNLTPDI